MDAPENQWICMARGGWPRTSPSSRNENPAHFQPHIFSLFSKYLVNRRDTNLKASPEEGGGGPAYSLVSNSLLRSKALAQATSCPEKGGAAHKGEHPSLGLGPARFTPDTWPKDPAVRRQFGRSDPAYLPCPYPAAQPAATSETFPGIAAVLEERHGGGPSASAHRHRRSQKSIRGRRWSLLPASPRHRSCRDRG